MTDRRALASCCRDYSEPRVVLWRTNCVRRIAAASTTVPAGFGQASPERASPALAEVVPDRCVDAELTREPAARGRLRRVYSLARGRRDAFARFGSAREIPAKDSRLRFELERMASSRRAAAPEWIVRIDRVWSAPEPRARNSVADLACCSVAAPRPGIA